MSTNLSLTLISRQDCHLCDEMASVVAEVLRGVPADLETLDVDADPDLLARYSEEVPVLLINGRKAFKYRVTVADLRRRLAAETGRGGQSS